VSNTFTLPTMISLAYEADRWGEHRIVLDTISNHIDACGTIAGVTVETGESWVAVRDSGPGFDWRLLGLLHSTKSPSGPNIGQFGEGMKLVAAACLRMGLHISIRSRDWKATALPEHVRFQDSSSSREERTVSRLVWEVTTDLAEFCGTETVISSPAGPLPEELAALFRKWRSLFLDDEYRTREDAWQDQNPRLFLKGVWCKDLEEYAFSYNLVSANISRDRTTMDTLSAVRRFWEYSARSDHIAMFFRQAAASAALRTTPAMEFRISLYPIRESDWVSGWNQAFGDAAVVSTTPQEDYHASAMGHPVVPLPETVVCVARRVGIRTARDVLSDENRFRLRELEPDEHARVAAAFRLIRRIRPDVEDYQVLAMDCPPSPDTLGLASRRNRSIYLSTELLRSGCARKLLRTLLEEVAHLESGAGDLERAFEDWCLEFATDTVLATEVS
jgi:hypothetical protein